MGEAVFNGVFFAIPTLVVAIFAWFMSEVAMELAARWVRLPGRMRGMVAMLATVGATAAAVLFLRAHDYPTLRMQRPREFHLYNDRTATVLVRRVDNDTGRSARIDAGDELVVTDRREGRGSPLGDLFASLGRGRVVVGVFDENDVRLGYVAFASGAYALWEVRLCVSLLMQGLEYPNYPTDTDEVRCPPLPPPVGRLYTGEADVDRGDGIRWTARTGGIEGDPTAGFVERDLPDGNGGRQIAYYPVPGKGGPARITGKRVERWTVVIDVRTANGRMHHFDMNAGAFTSR